MVLIYEVQSIVIYKILAKTLFTGQNFHVNNKAMVFSVKLFPELPIRFKEPVLSMF